MLVSPDSPVKEHDTFTCGHSGRIVFVPGGCKPDQAGGFCRVCMRHICFEEVGKPCVVLEKRIDAMERQPTKSLDQLMHELGAAPVRRWI